MNSRLDTSSTAPRFAGWRPKRKGEIPLRPSEGELATGEQLRSELWDCMATLPSFAAIRGGDSIDKWREFSLKDRGTGAVVRGRGHLLMRPLGQLILAEAVGWLHLSPSGPQLPLEEIFEKLHAYDRDGGFEAAKRETPWYGVTYDPARQRMVITDREVAALMVEYLVAGDMPAFTPVMREKLLTGFRKRRTLPGTTEGEFVYLDADGMPVDVVEEIDLPKMI